MESNCSRCDDINKVVAFFINIYGCVSNGDFSFRIYIYKLAFYSVLMRSNYTGAVYVTIDNEGLRMPSATSGVGVANHCSVA